MHNEFEMIMMGELKFFLGIQIHKSLEGWFIHQTKYIRELLKKLKMDDWMVMGTPMHPIFSLEKDENGKQVDQKVYRGMVGSLIYLFCLACACVPDFNMILKNPT